MWNFLLPAITPIIDKLVDLIPNGNERARAREKFEFELMKAVNDAAEQQNAVNQVEAAHNSVFVAGWRPFIGWVCGVGITWAYLVHPLLMWAVAAYNLPIQNIPALDTDGLYQLVLAMLGLGGLRTFEKVKGVTK